MWLVDHFRCSAGVNDSALIRVGFKKWHRVLSGSGGDKWHMGNNATAEYDRMDRTLTMQLKGL